MTKYKLVPVDPTPEHPVQELRDIGVEQDERVFARIAALSERKASQAQPVQEPYAWEVRQGGRTFFMSAQEFTGLSFDCGSFKQLYTAPPDTDALLRQALEALEADDCILWPSEKRGAAITAMRKHFGEKA